MDCPYWNYASGSETSLADTAVQLIVRYKQRFLPHLCTANQIIHFQQFRRQLLLHICLYIRPFSTSYIIFQKLIHYSICWMYLALTQNMLDISLYGNHTRLTLDIPPLRFQRSQTCTVEVWEHHGNMFQNTSSIFRQ